MPPGTTHVVITNLVVSGITSYLSLLMCPLMHSTITINTPPPHHLIGWLVSGTFLQTDLVCYPIQLTWELGPSSALLISMVCRKNPNPSSVKALTMAFHETCMKNI